jgi:hypothetical protein
MPLASSARANASNPYLSALLAIAGLGLIGGGIAWLVGWFTAQNADYMSDGATALLWMAIGGSVFGVGVLFGFGVILYGALTHHLP